MHTRSSFSLVGLIVALVVIMFGSIFVANFSTTAVAVDPAVTPQETFEYDTNRGGSDYRSFETQADPTICRNECAKDATCRAFTYVKPGVQGPNAKCWLKNSVPGASANNCCVSGIKREAVSPSGLEVDVNRRGSDYRHYDLPSNNPNQCRDDCMNDPKCRSFTFLRPSYWGVNAHCFLKDSVPGATQESCCISGVKPGGGGAGGDANRLKGMWDFVCCGNQYSGGLFFVPDPAGGSRFTGYMYQQDHTIAGEINGDTVTFKRTFSGGSWDVRLTLNPDGTLTGSFTGAAPANLPRDIRATKRQ